MLCCLPGFALASEDRPLWELGVGVGGLSFPVYRGSDQRRDFLLPVPYFVYRGEVFKSDRKGERLELIDSERLELSISGSASLPVGSDEVLARRGMPGLKATLGVGPSLDLLLWKSAGGEKRLTFQLPVSASFTLQKQPEFVGWQTSPRLNLDIDHPLGLDGWQLGLLAGPIYASRAEHNYFYTVEPAYATAARPAYQAPGGYAGMQMLAAVSKRYPTFWLGGFIRYDSLKGAVFADSPLLRKDSYLAAGFGIAWILGESTRRVFADD